MPSLCKTCRNATNVKGHTLQQEITTCTGLHPAQRITFPVSECSEYDDKRVPSLHEMYKIAWKVSADKQGRPAGFVTPNKFKDLVTEGKVQTTMVDEDHDY